MKLSTTKLREEISKLESILVGLKRVNISKWKVDSGDYILEHEDLNFVLYKNTFDMFPDYVLKIKDLKTGVSLNYRGRTFRRQIRPFYQEIEEKINDYSKSRIINNLSKMHKETS